MSTADIRPADLLMAQAARQEAEEALTAAMDALRDRGFRVIAEPVKWFTCRCRDGQHAGNTVFERTHRWDRDEAERATKSDPSAHPLPIYSYTVIRTGGAS